jgi:hypothetical protein
LLSSDISFRKKRAGLGMIEALTVSLETAALVATCAELRSIAQRRGSLPEFRRRLREIVERIPGVLETIRVHPKDGAADAGELVLALEFGEPLLGLVSALRALDREFDLRGKVHRRLLP